MPHASRNGRARVLSSPRAGPVRPALPALPFPPSREPRMPAPRSEHEQAWCWVGLPAPLSSAEPSQPKAQPSGRRTSVMGPPPPFIHCDLPPCTDLRLYGEPLRETRNLGAGGCWLRVHLPRGSQHNLIFRQDGTPLKGTQARGRPHSWAQGELAFESRVPTSFPGGSTAHHGVSQNPSVATRPLSGSASQNRLVCPTPITARPSTGPVTRGHGPCPPHPGPCLARNSVMVFAG